MTEDETEFEALQVGDSRTVLERVRTLHGVTWEWIDESYRADARRRYMGLIAQDVERVFPEAIARDEDEKLMVDYAGLVGALVECVKELAERVEVLEARDG